MNAPEAHVDLDGTGFELVRRYASATREIKRWTEYRAELREYLLKLVGDAGTARHMGLPVLTVIRTRPRRFNFTAFASDHPDLAEQYREAPAEDEIRIQVGRLPVEEGGS